MSFLKKEYPNDNIIPNHTLCHSKLFFQLHMFQMDNTELSNIPILQLYILHICLRAYHSIHSVVLWNLGICFIAASALTSIVLLVYFINSLICFLIGRNCYLKAQASTIRMKNNHPGKSQVKNIATFKSNRVLMILEMERFDRNLLNLYKVFSCSFVSFSWTLAILASAFSG